MYGETFAARALALALTSVPEFPAHVVSARAGRAESIARRHVRRDQGRRVELLTLYFDRAAEAPMSDAEHLARMYVWNIAPTAWFVGAPSTDPNAPKRTRDGDAIPRAALRIARRGAGRCADPVCCTDPATGRGVGALLAADATGDYCTACAARQGHARSDVEGERDLFDRAAYVLLDGVDSRARLRRAA